MAGLNAKQRKDKRLMDQIAVHTRLEPTDRNARIASLAKQLFAGDNLCQASFSDENLNPTTDAIRLNPPKIVTAKGQEATVRDGLFQVK